MEIQSAQLTVLIQNTGIPMAEELTGNVLVAQSGGPTAVINASLAGVIEESLNHGCIEEIYGGLNGIQGILQERFIDLAEEVRSSRLGGFCRTANSEQF